MDEQRAAGRYLFDLAQPYLQSGDKDGLAQRLSGAWSGECLRVLLEDDDTEVARTAAICLGLIGDQDSGQAIAKLLHHDTPSVVDAAEEALWSIWFQQSGPMAQAVLTRIAEAIRTHETECVVPLLTELIRSYPDYAEAYHQRSQAYFLEDAFQSAMRDARRAFNLNPLHFAALANQAHIHVALGQHQEALRRYRQVLRIHPHFEGIRDAIHQLREHLTLAEA